MSEQYPLIPDEAFLFIPSQNDIKPKLRKIFGGNVPLEHHQIAKIKQFDQYVSRNRIIIDKDFDTPMKLRFLQSCGYNCQKSIKGAIQYTKWRKSMPKQIPNKILNILNNGVCYMSGRDMHYRPILVTDVKKMIKMGFDHEDLLMAQSYFFSYIIHHAFIQGQIQNWITIIDLGYTGLFSVSGPFKKSISLLSDMFRARMFLTSVVNCASSISMLWGMAKGFVDQQTQKKIAFQSSGIATQLFKISNPSQIQVKYGGTLPNITKFWPPSLISTDFKLNANTNLVTIQQYKNKYQKGQLQNRKVNKKFLKNYQPPSPQLIGQHHVKSLQKQNSRSTNQYGFEKKPILKTVGFQNDDKIVNYSTKSISPVSTPIITGRSQFITKQTKNKETPFSKQLSEFSEEYLIFEQSINPVQNYKFKEVKKQLPQIKSTQQLFQQNNHQTKQRLTKNRHASSSRPKLNYVPIKSLSLQKPTPLFIRDQKQKVFFIESPKVNFIPYQTTPPNFKQSRAQYYN